MLTLEELETKIRNDLNKLLNDYSDVFEEPKGMPPVRSHDHAIVLKPDA